MKKLVILLFALFCLSPFAFSKSIPTYTNSIKVVGIGIIRLPKEFKIYSQPDTKSKVIKEYKLGNAEGSYINDDYSDNFIIYDPVKRFAFMTVVEDSEDGWYKICYDQTKKLTGWVLPSKYEFYSWLSFFTKYGKTNGLYAFRDISEFDNKLYSQPDINSQVLKKFKHIRTMRVLVFRGNWVFLRVYDYDGNLMMGWYKWRTDDGKFMLFPIIK